MREGLQPDPVSRRASAEATESISRVPRTPLDRGRCCWVPLYLPILFPQPLLGLLPTNSMSPSSALGIPGGAQTGGFSIHLWPPHPVPCPAWHSTGHTLQCPGPQRHQGSSSCIQHLVSCLYFLGSCQRPRSLNSCVCPGHSRLSGKGSCQG